MAAFPVSEFDIDVFLVRPAAIAVNDLAFDDPAETNKPTISNVVPTPPGPLGKFEAVSLDVLDDTGLRLVLLTVEFADGTYDVIHDGVSFATKYGGLRTAYLGGGFHYSFQRNDGWLASPSFRVFAVDVKGNSA